LVHDFLWRNLARGLDERLPDLARSSGEPRGMTVADAGTDATGVADPSAGYQPTHEGGLGAMLGGTQALATAGRVAVIGRRYALDIDDHGVVLVDLVCARRILVARALAVAPDSAPLPSRPLLLPLPVECSEQQADRVEALNESLGQLGFELRRIAPGTLTAHAVPAALAHVPVGHLIAVILRWSGEGSRPAAAVLCESLATIAGECLDDLLSSGESMKSFLRALDRHAAELAKIRARLRLDAGALEALLRRWSG
ncbi:MAG TPA: hypothetical protein VFG48_01225, partial [Xanthomonadales bacterium]|nr:hypothetical protein [Xanthomonadales bacterium]